MFIQNIETGDIQWFEGGYMPIGWKPYEGEIPTYNSESSIRIKNYFPIIALLIILYLAMRKK